MGGGSDAAITLQEVGVDRVRLGLADAAVEGVLDRQGTEVSGVFPGVEQEGLGPGVGLADGAAAEPADPFGIAATDPATHGRRIMADFSAFAGRDQVTECVR